MPLDLAPPVSPHSVIMVGTIAEPIEAIELHIQDPYPFHHHPFVSSKPLLFHASKLDHTIESELWVTMISNALVTHVGHDLITTTCVTYFVATTHLPRGMSTQEARLFGDFRAHENGSGYLKGRLLRSSIYSWFRAFYPKGVSMYRYTTST